MTHSFPTRRSSDLANDYRNGTQQCAGEQREQHDETAVGSQVMEVEIDRNRCGVKRRERSANQYEDQHHQRVDDKSEEHTSELQSLMRISYAVFCLKKKNRTKKKNNRSNDIQ